MPSMSFSQKAFNEQKMQKVNLFETERMFCDLYCFEPGQEQKTHTHAGADKIYYVLEGRGTFPHRWGKSRVAGAYHSDSASRC